MTVRTVVFALAVANLAAVRASTSAVAPSPVPADLLPSDVPGIHLPVLREHTYSMSGRVRLLLFWVGRDDVGSGVIRWRENGADHAYELLIGSDPLRAPGRLNKWGYLAEAVREGDTTVFGVISKSTEDSIADVKAGLSSPAEGRPFNAIRARVTPRQAYTRVSTVHAASTVTYREAGTVLALALGEQPTTVKQIDRPANVRPGFLSTMAELINDTMREIKSKPRASPRVVAYVYGDRLYELRLLGAELLPLFEHEGRSFPQVVRGRFETGLPGQRPGSRFEVVFGTSGPWAGVPIVISYQPKWWLQVELMALS
jgi:hypothetical protein